MHYIKKMKKSKTRIFVSQTISANLIIYIKNKQHHFLKNVLRVKINDKINIFDVDKDINIEKKMDLVISLKSMGYHYPFENYISLFTDCCNKETTFIFDISSEQYDVSFFKKYFDFIKVIYSEESIHPLKRLCCKELKL